MLKDSLRGFLLLIGRIAVLAEDAADEDADLGLGSFHRGITRFPMLY